MHRLFIEIDSQFFHQKNHLAINDGLIVQMPPQYLKHGNKIFRSEAHFLFTTDKFYLPYNYTTRNEIKQWISQ